MRADQPNRANSIIVTRNGPVDEGRVTVSVGKGDNRNPCSACLSNSDVLAPNVYNKKCARQGSHLFDATKIAIHLLHKRVQFEGLFLREALKLSMGLSLLKTD